MFQIESTDAKDLNVRVLILTSQGKTIVQIKRQKDGVYVTSAERGFDDLESAENAYNLQRKLLTCLAAAHGPNYKLTEGVNIAPTQLSLEIAA